LCCCVFVGIGFFYSATFLTVLAGWITIVGLGLGPHNNSHYNILAYSGQMLCDNVFIFLPFFWLRQLFPLFVIFWTAKYNNNYGFEILFLIKDSFTTFIHHFFF
jgi:hypothetical protein